MAIAQTNDIPALPQTKLTVGVSHRPPFAIKTPTESGSDWDGIGVHLWREVAEALNIQYEWKEISPTQTVVHLQDGKCGYCD